MDEGVAAEKKGFHVLADVALDNAAECVRMIHRDLRNFWGKGEHTHDSTIPTVIALFEARMWKGAKTLDV